MTDKELREWFQYTAAIIANTEQRINDKFKLMDQKLQYTLRRYPSPREWEAILYERAHPTPIPTGPLPARKYQPWENRPQRESPVPNSSSLMDLITGNY